MKRKGTSLPTKASDISYASHSKYKADPELGKEIFQYLRSVGVAAPLKANKLTITQKRKKIASLFNDIIDTLGLDIEDDSLKDTPARIAKMYVDEAFYGLDYRNFPKCTSVENRMNYSEIVIERNINVQSVCEHHFVAIDGFAHVGYIPKHKVVGLSKLNRIVDFFSRRPQIQERLTEQVFHSLKYILDTEDIAIMVKAQHYCVKSRGIGDVNSDTITSKLGGIFLSDWNCRHEFLSLSSL